MDKIEKNFFNEYRCERIDSMNIMNRIMRYENYIIALIQEEILDLRLFASTPLWTEAMIWNIKGIIISNFNQETFQLIEDESSVTSLRSRILLSGIWSIFASPFVFLYFSMFYFLKYFAQFRHSPASLAERKWTTYALWKMRYINELPHFFERRIADSHGPATKYYAQFPNRLLSIIAKFFMFLTSSFAFVIVLFGIVKPNGLLTVMIFGYNLAYWLTMLLVIWVSLRGLAIDKNTVFKPNKQMAKVIHVTGYCPDSWKNEGRLMAHTPKVFNDFKQLFQNHLIVFLQEMGSIFTTPYFLLFRVVGAAPQIFAFLKDNTIHINKVGDVCKSSNFNQVIPHDDKMNKSIIHIKNLHDNELNETIGMSRAKRDLFESRLNPDISVHIEQME